MSYSLFFLEIFRFAGNTVFPNGEVKMALNVLSSGSKLVIYGDPAGAKQFYAKINQTVCQLEFDAAWQCSIPLGDHTGKLELTLRKADGNAAYPAFRAAAVLKK